MHLHHQKSDKLFRASLFSFLSIYALLILLLLLASTSQLTTAAFLEAITSPEIQYSLLLTFLTCTVSAILSLLFSIPIGYLLSRYPFKGKKLICTLLDIPIILPPIVIGLSLLILFNTLPSAEYTLENWLNTHGLSVTFAIPAIILSQFTIATAFSLRSIKNTFDHIPNRQEKIALTLGCNHLQSFWKISLPQAGRGVLSAGLLAWARSLGEFGPILIFAGATRGHTEVLATSIFLELNIGNLSGAAAVSLLLISIAVITTFSIRLLGENTPS